MLGTKIVYHKTLIWFGLWCLTRLTPFLTIFQLYWWRKPLYPEKTTDLSHNVVSSTPRHERG